METKKPSQVAGAKRKRDVNPATEDDILRLESEVASSPKHYNHISTLIGLARQWSSKSQSDSAVLALCRIFTRLFSESLFRGSTRISAHDGLVQRWLEDRYVEFTRLCLQALGQGKPRRSILCLKVLMKLVETEVCYQGHKIWLEDLFYQVLGALLDQKCDANVRDVFVNDYVRKYDDVQFNMLHLLKIQVIDALQQDRDVCVEAIELMTGVGQPPSEDSKLTSNYLTRGKSSADMPPKVKLAKAHRKKGQEVWFAIFQLDMNKHQRTQLLKVMVHKVLPWINALERMMDFFTDSFNNGGEMSLLALSGLFHLIQERNLDYPSFYQKLYSLLDDQLLQSKHRSRFFRLLETFMASTHLPAALVASFIKRLSRLALEAPPSGIVVVIPWVYNMFKLHPSCTYMMHRESRDEEEEREWEEYGAEDPFDMTEPNPMETGAIDSCVWELGTLQSHYHPNVATLAKIISEQFTKQQYSLEDFLDYSYNSLLDTELSKTMKKSPVVEYQISKTILAGDETTMENSLGSLLGAVLKTS